MKKIIKPLVICLGLLIITNTANAQRYWPPVLTNWSLYLNNGVANILSPEFASHCSHSRGAILMDGTEFNKAQYAYAVSAKAKGKNLKYVIGNTHTNCVITGLQEVD